ncbi:unnamed protein product [Mytilus coruscus]|uniref:Uncharacterized protein n=1 Tax=Mytilus coruscus TaxID=42192 RepID=A0A6J8CYW8_MYTCO|nr:unnamed protein product [Mytilus coruscus]
MSSTASPVINQQLIDPPMTKSRSIIDMSLTTTSPVINQQLINRPTTEGQIIDFMPQTTTNAWHAVLSRMNTLLNNLNSQLDTMVYDRNGQGGTQNINHLTNDLHLKTPVGLTGEINNQSNRGTGSPIALPLVSGNGQGLVAQNAFHKDGIVVSDVGSLLMQNPGVLYVERPSIDIASSWEKLSQVPLGFVDNTINQNINAQQNNLTGSRLQGNKPIVISDPKTKFSFKKLDARNVDVLGIAVDAPTVANENSIISQPKISVLNSPEIFRKHNFVFSEPRDQPLSDVTLPKLNKRNAEESFHNSNNVPVNIKIIGGTSSQDKIVNARILDKLLRGLNSGISISNTAQDRQEVNKTASSDIKNSIKAENRINSIGTGTNPLKLMSKKSQSNSVNVWTKFKSLIPTEISNSMNSLFNRSQNNGKSKQYNVWNQFKQEKQQTGPSALTNSMDTAFNSIMNNGLWVYPKTTPIKRTTQGPILGGATNSMLDLMAGLWNSQTTAYPLYQGNTIV